MEQPVHDYQFDSRKGNNYGSTDYSAEEMRRAYEEDAPTCHHPGRTMGRVAFENMATEDRLAIHANAEAAGLDEEWRNLTAE